MSALKPENLRSRGHRCVNGVVLNIQCAVPENTESKEGGKKNKKKTENLRSRGQRCVNGVVLNIQCAVPENTESMEGKNTKTTKNVKNLPLDSFGA